MARFLLRMFLNLGVRFSFIVVLTLGTSGMAWAGACQYCQGKSPAELADISINSGSNSLRSQLRAYLAENFPDTGYGVFGKAWVANANGAPKEEVIALYKRAVELEPGFIAARMNLGFAQNKAGQHDAAIRPYRQALSLRSPDPLIVRNMYFWIDEQDRKSVV